MKYQVWRWSDVLNRWTLEATFPDSASASDCVWFNRLRVGNRMRLTTRTGLSWQRQEG